MGNNKREHRFTGRQRNRRQFVSLPGDVLKISILLFLLLALAPQGFAQHEVVDKIAAVVGDEVILASELASQIQMVAFQTGRRPKTESEIEAFQKEVLEQMVTDRLFLMEAKKDTSITVRHDEVEMARDEQIARAASNFESHAAFLDALAAEGMTLRDLERKYSQEIENNMLRQRYIQKKLYNVSVSRKEVDEFYNSFQDSIPNQPEAARLSHILLKVTPAPEIEDSVKNLATELRQRIIDGADFATISAQYSSKGAGANGGDLGYIRRDDVVPEFARAAFKLNPGDISGVIRTQFGYHVIKCEGVRGDQLRLRHVLLEVAASPADTARTMALADSLKTEIENGADFAELAKTYSTDDDTRAQGGELGWFAIKQLPPDLAPTVTGWTTAGEIRGPITTRFGIHLIKLLDYQPEKELTLKDNFDQIKEMARQDKTGKMVDKWINEIKARTFVDYKLENLK